MADLQQLDGVRWSQYDEATGLLLAWHGGHGIRAYDSEGKECLLWNIGDWSKSEATIEEVQENMREHIEKQDYLDY